MSIHMYKGNISIEKDLTCPFYVLCMQCMSAPIPGRVIKVVMDQKMSACM